MDKIKAVHPRVETTLSVVPERVQLLILENPREFFSVVYGLLGQFDGKEGDFVFLDGDNEVDIKEAGEMVADLFRFDLNDKKLLNLLYRKLERQALERENYSLLDCVNNEIFLFLKSVFSEFPFSLSYEEVSPGDLFKAVGVKFEKVYDGLLEKIICYINAVVTLKNCRIFVFVNLKSALCDDDLLLLYEHCEREKVGLLLIESGKLRPLLGKERAIIITEDLCEIVENYE